MPLAANVPTASVELDRPRTLAFTLGAMRRIKERLGSLDLGGEGAIDALGTYVWACLIEEDREGLTPEMVEDMIHPGNMEAVSEAIAALTGGAEGNAVPAPPKVKAGKK